MLVLSRKQDKGIHIGDEIHVKILGLQNGVVRLGIAAPREIPVHRDEVYEAIQTEKAAGDGAPPTGGDQTS